MQLLKIGAGVLNQTPLDWSGNAQRIKGAIRAAKSEHVKVLCLPEMCIPGYGFEDTILSPAVQETCLDILRELLPHTKGIVVTLGLPIGFRNALFNAVCLVADGEIRGFVAKQYLAGDGVHYEPRWFNPWPRGNRDTVRIGETEYPIGDLLFDVDGIRLGVEICEDAWVARRPGAEMAYLGVDLILNPSASHFAFGKFETRKRFIVEGSRAFNCSYIYANQVGNAAGRVIYDGGALIASGERLLAEGPRFSYKDADITTATVDLDQTRMRQAKSHSFEPSFDKDSAIHFSLDLLSTEESLALSSSNTPSGWQGGDNIKEEEFTRAVALGLFDYMRKSHSHGYVVSLSGGADSSACACLIAMMVHLGMEELGISGLREKLQHISGLDQCNSAEDCIGQLLLCVYQATDNSSETTLNAAKSVAQAIGADFLEYNIQSLVDGYLDIVSDAIGRSLNWEEDDVPLQNIQARTRGPGIWLLANLRRAILVATSNRSEAAVGYTTMDGDTCGGLSPIAGIDKAFLLSWLSWMEQAGPDGIQNVPALSYVTAQTPTAELRPLTSNQTDEADLMPYPVLDAIERAAIRDRRMPTEVFQQLRRSCSQYSVQELAGFIKRFFRLWAINQWKRERYAPSFHLDDENLDPKTWCRFPILSGGFDLELKRLDEYIKNL